MGGWLPIVPNRRVILAEAGALRTFLGTDPRGERGDILPFFNAHPQLCAFLATYNQGVHEGNRIAYEFSLWGDFACDLVAGDRHTGAYTFVEFENASVSSMFRAVKGRRNTRWGTNVEGGISQVTDWLFRLASAADTAEMVRDFDSRRIRPVGMVIAGRSSDITAYDDLRLKWRSANTIIGGTGIAIMTYDDLLVWLEGRLALLKDIEGGTDET